MNGEAAVILDGTDDYVRAPSITWGATASWGGWMRLADANQTLNPVPFSCDYGYGVQSYYDNERLRFSIRLVGGSPTTKDWTHGWSDSVVEQWHHVGWTYDGTIMRCYVDGIQRTTLTSGTTIQEPNTYFYFGKNPGGSFFGGGLADYRHYPNTVLTSGNMLTLASTNPATDVSGNYADPDNDFGAALWYKFGATATGTLDVTNYGTSGASHDATKYAGAKSGFVRFLKADPAGDTDAYKFQHDANYATNAAAGTVTLTNTYVSGSEDIILASGNHLHTKGTVVLD
jgi:hypothetical protein